MPKKSIKNHHFSIYKSLVKPYNVLMINEIFLIDSKSRSKEDVMEELKSLMKELAEAKRLEAVDAEVLKQNRAYMKMVKNDWIAASFMKAENAGVKGYEYFMAKNRARIVEEQLMASKKAVEILSEMVEEAIAFQKVSTKA